MKITRIESIPVEVPLKQGMMTKTAHGEHITSPYVILKVHTDEGIIGLGEATVAPRWSGEASRGCVAVVEDLFEPALIGADPTAITQVCAVMDEVIKLNPFAKSAVEMALWDILGKVRGKPLYELLGGKGIAQIARASGIVCHMGSNLELGVATAAMAHLAAAEHTIDSETYPADILGPLYHDSDLIEVPVTIGPDGARPPEGDGLGVALDEDAIDNYRVG